MEKFLLGIFCCVLLPFQEVKLEDTQSSMDSIISPRSLTCPILYQRYTTYKQKYEDTLIVNQNLEGNLSSVLNENQLLKNNCSKNEELTTEIQNLKQNLTIKNELFQNLSNSYEELLIEKENMEQTLTNLVAENESLKSNCTEKLNETTDHYQLELANLQENYENQLNETQADCQRQIDVCDREKARNAMLENELNQLLIAYEKSKEESVN
ncbi:uncharacterized protein LOC126740676 [Anthonomus grandis grandis]|uniref:uncharacterized protein LOC126740676 n=1 Tax=Anthonomus grandis grandis TaxID=2921223 RepID=UPI002165B3DE|nr:uncharacterized protein LOC126740676 [Anthonomus grandis grandis]